MSIRAIDHPSRLYSFLRAWIRTGLSLFYRRLEYRGWENIPTKGAVLFAPNHQSAMVDAVAVLSWQRQAVVFMARADMFKHPFVAKGLRVIKMMPIYRLRDGYNQLGKNQALMDEAAHVLVNQHYLCLMPEGGQSGKRRLKPLVKGLFRIAFSAKEQLTTNDKIYIVPVGIDYTEYEHSGADLTIDFGPAIDIAHYQDNDENKNINHLRDELSQRISSLMQDIRNDDWYEEIYRLSYWAMPSFLQDKLHPTAFDCLDARKRLTRKLEQIIEEAPDTWQTLLSESKQLRNMPGNLNDNVWFLEGGASRTNYLLIKQWLILLVTLPGRLINWPLRALIHRILRLDRDKQMHATYRLAMGTFGFPIFYALTSLLIGILLRLPAMFICLIFLWMSLAGILTERFRPLWRRQAKQLAYRSQKKRSEYEALREEYNRFKALCQKVLF